MTENHLYSFITMEKKSSLSECQHCSSFSFPLFGLIEIILIGFFKWVSFAQIFFGKFLSVFQLQRYVSENKSKDLCREHADDDGLCREDVVMVMKSLGLLNDSESEGLQKRYCSEELSNLFEEKEPSLGEVKQAFDVFDENRDGFLDPTDLQRVLTILGLKEGSNLDNCRRMIELCNGNKDGRIDFHGFVKFMENKFC